MLDAEIKRDNEGHVLPDVGCNTRRQAVPVLQEQGNPELDLESIAGSFKSNLSAEEVPGTPEREVDFDEEVYLPEDDFSYDGNVPSGGEDGPGNGNNDLHEGTYEEAGGNDTYNVS